MARSPVEEEHGIIHRTIDYTKPWFKALQRDRRSRRQKEADRVRFKPVTSNPNYPVFYDEDDWELTPKGLINQLIVRKTKG